jgi:hypothetical protein
MLLFIFWLAVALLLVIPHLFFQPTGETERHEELEDVQERRAW